MSRQPFLALVAFLVLAPCGASLAQTPPQAGTPGGPGEEAPHPAETDKVIPEKLDPRLPGSTNENPASLSEKLDASNGVIRPPGNIDPEMQKTPPQQRDPAMRVLPPTVSPDGRPAEPK